LDNNKDGKLPQVVYLASLVGDIFYLGKKNDSIQKFTEGCERLLGISSDDAEHLLQNVHPQLIEIAAYFDIAIGSGKTYEEILSMVNEEVINITTSNEAIKHHLTQAFDRERALALKLEEANRKLLIMASKDPLTGLYNRQFLNELFEKEWSRAQRHGYPLSIIMADIDDFKRVNDDYGHQVGDLALKKIAEVLSENLRINDYLARYGGEEFLFVLPQATLRDACNAAERFRMAIRKISIPLDKDHNLSLSISCGVSTAYPEQKDENVIVLIEKADNALYKAKHLGKDRVVSYEEDDHPLIKKSQLYKLTGNQYNSLAI